MPNCQPIRLSIRRLIYQSVCVCHLVYLPLHLDISLFVHQYALVYLICMHSWKGSSRGVQPVVKAIQTRML